MNNSNSSMRLPKSTKSNHNRQDFWNGTLVDDYNFLMSEELIYHCKSSLSEPFSSWNDLAVHHVSYNEFEKQYIELSDWCGKSSQIIKKISSNTLTCYLRQKSYEDLYEQGLMRLRMFNQYSNKLIERFPDLRIVINEKMKIIYRIWNELEARFIRYLDEDFDRIIEELCKELFLFEEWIIEIEEQLEKFRFIRNEKNLLENCQQVMKLQNEIKSKNSCVSSVIEICERLKNDYKQQIDQIPFDYATDLENRWHQIWIYSLEIQCKIEEKIKISKHSNTFSLINDDDEEEDDIIPFNSSEYEKISLTSSNSSEINSSLSNRKRPRSPTIYSILTNLNRKMAKSKRRMSLNILPNLSPSIFYYSLTNINDYDDSIPSKKQKKNSSKLDIGYASEDDFDRKPIYSLKKSRSDFTIYSKPTSNILSSLTHSLPLFEHNEWWRHSITSAYDTCSNPDIDLSIDETKQIANKPSLLIYSKKYRTSKEISNSYDASVEYTDAEQSENDGDILSSPIHHYQNAESLFYNRYTTATTGYSSDIEFETTTTIPSEIEISPINSDKLPMESSEPCWDGYQNPLFYPLNSQDIDSIETTLKWDDQFFEMDQPCYSTSDDELQKYNRFLRNNNGSSLSLITSVTKKQDEFDSDSDLDDFNYVISETNRQLVKTRHSLEKKKRQRQLTSILNDRNQRKYDEILRTCQTNIQCLQSILKNLHHSNNSRLYNTRAIELLQTYLSDWHDMQQQILDDRTRARHLLHISQEIIKLKLRLDDESTHINTSFHSSWFENNSLNDLKHRIYYEFQLEKDNRLKLELLQTDIHLAEQHLKEYRMAYPDGPSSLNIDEHLHSSRLTLDQLTTKMDSYQIQLRTLLTMIDNLLPIENHIEQKLTSFDYPFDLQEMQTLMDNYERMIPMNKFYEIVKNHCEYKLTIYRKMFNDILRKQDKHVSINFNNNNSTTINSSTSRQDFTNKKFNRQSEIRDRQQNFTTTESSHRQSSTSSYISDDCKVLYIETVIEVDKPVFYERTTDTSSITNTQYHHHIPRRTSKYIMDNTNNNHAGDSTDDEQPVNSNHSKQHIDSINDFDQNSSSTTMYDQQPQIDPLIFPQSNRAFEETSEPTLLHRVQQQREFDNENQNQFLTTRVHFNSSNTLWNRFKQHWFLALFIGLLICLGLFIIYLFALDSCSRSAFIQSIGHAIIHIDHAESPLI